MSEPVREGLVRIARQRALFGETAKPFDEASGQRRPEHDVGESRHVAGDATEPPDQAHGVRGTRPQPTRSEEHTSELQSLMRTPYAVFCLKKQKNTKTIEYNISS